MSLLLQDCAGTVHVISQSEGAGFYQVNPGLPSLDEAKSIITSIPLQFDEIVQPSVTIDDQRALYVFGSAWSQMSVNGMLLLGPDSAGGTIMNEFISWYETNRVSALESGISVSMADRGLEVFVVGMQLGAVDPNMNKQDFTIKLLTTKD